MRMSSSVGRLGKAGVQGSSDIAETGPVALNESCGRRESDGGAPHHMAISPHLPSSSPIGYANPPQAQARRLGTWR